MKIQHTEKVLLKKDLLEIWSQPSVRALFLLVPLLCVVVLPILALLFVTLLPLGFSENIEAFFKFLPENGSAYAAKGGLFQVATARIFPILFLAVPILISAAATASCFIGEQERGTMLPLLLTPVSVRRIAGMKLFVSLALAILVTVLSFFLLLIVVTIGDILLEIPFFINAEWLITFFLLAPLLAALSALSVIHLSVRGQRQGDAFRSSTFLMFALILIYILPFTGLYQLNISALLYFAIFLLCVVFVLFVSLPARFTAEKLTGKR